MITGIGTILSAILYRLGGAGFGSWIRDWLIPVVAVTWMHLTYNPLPPDVVLWKFIVASIFMYGAMGGALTTYWDKLWGWDNFWMHGVMIGVADVLYVWVGVISWKAFIVRVMVLGTFMGFLNFFLEKYKVKYRDYIDEGGRGSSIIFSRLIYLIPFLK